jgi:hypothetical protein
LYNFKIINMPDPKDNETGPKPKTVAPATEKPKGGKKK